MKELLSKVDAFVTHKTFPDHQSTKQSNVMYSIIGKNSEGYSATAVCCAMFAYYLTEQIGIGIDHPTRLQALLIACHVICYLLDLICLGFEPKAHQSIAKSPVEQSDAQLKHSAPQTCNEKEPKKIVDIAPAGKPHGPGVNEVTKKLSELLHNQFDVM